MITAEASTQIGEIRIYCRSWVVITIPFAVLWKVILLNALPSYMYVAEKNVPSEFYFTTALDPSFASEILTTLTRMVSPPLRCRIQDKQAGLAFVSGSSVSSLHRSGYPGQQDQQQRDEKQNRLCHAVTSVADIVPVSSTVILKFLCDPSVEDFKIISVVLIPYPPNKKIFFAPTSKVTSLGSPSTDNMT